jgi:hypothetical protein
MNLSLTRMRINAVPAKMVTFDICQTCINKAFFAILRIIECSNTLLGTEKIIDTIEPSAPKVTLLPSKPGIAPVVSADWGFQLNFRKFR